MQNLLHLFSSYAARQPNLHLRPKGRPCKGRQAQKWWKYASTASLRASQAPFSWTALAKASNTILAYACIIETLQILNICTMHSIRPVYLGLHELIAALYVSCPELFKDAVAKFYMRGPIPGTDMQTMSLRKRYVPAYIKCLQENNQGGDEEIEAMDKDLPEQTILVFRRLAHAQVWTSFSIVAIRGTMHQKYYYMFTQMQKHIIDQIQGLLAGRQGTMELSTACSPYHPLRSLDVGVLARSVPYLLYHLIKL